MVKPQNELFRTCVDVVKLLCQLGGVLSYSVTTRRTAVKSQACRVGTMIVGWHPVGTTAFYVTPRFGTVVMAECKQMMKAERHHVIDNSFAAVEHHLFESVGHLLWSVFGIVQRHRHPLVDYLLTAELRIPGKSTEGIPVGLCHGVACPVGVIAHIGHSCNRLQ